MSTEIKPRGVNELTLFNKFLDTTLSDLRHWFMQPNSMVYFQITNCIIETNNLQKTGEHHQIVETVMTLLQPYANSIKKKDQAIFYDDQPVEILPGIDFRPIWAAELNDDQRNQLWKYLKNLYRLGSSVLKGRGLDTDKLLQRSFEAKEERERLIKQQQKANPLGNMFKSLMGGGSGDGDNTGAPGFDPTAIINMGRTMNQMFQGGQDGSNPLSYIQEISQDMMKEMQEKGQLPGLNESSSSNTQSPQMPNMQQIGQLFQNVMTNMQNKMQNGEIDVEKMQEAASAFHQVMPQPHPHSQSQPPSLDEES